jgi:ATP-binding cassette subfamily A (ABC1) protein 3
MDQMTVLEHLYFYASIRGVPSPTHNVNAVLFAVGLTPFATRMAAKLSGGNKRKLSLGIALIGNPTVLLLDEPSSGMDAASKRIMWKTLANVKEDRCLLLTTHSMEEADALADRAGIMAKRMLASGTTEYLRRTNGNMLYVHLVLKSAPHTSEDEIENLKTWAKEIFPGAVLEDQTYHGQIKFSVPASTKVQRDGGGEEIKFNIKSSDGRNSQDSRGIQDDDIISENDIGGRHATSDEGIGSLIMLLEEHREELGLEHYSVSPTTLDQVFLSIVGAHNVQEEGYVEKKRRKWASWWKRS